MKQKTKLCPACKAEKPVSEFSKNKTTKDGLRTQCKSCDKAYREANKDKQVEYNKAYREANKDKMAEYRKAWYEANKDKILEDKKAYYEANKDKRAEYHKAYREANKDKRAEYNKAWYEANKDKMTEYHKAWYEANKDKRAEYHKAYRKANKDKMAEYRKAYLDANKDKIAEYRKAYYKSPALFSTFAHQIEYAEEVKRNAVNPDLLEVKCTYCGKWYVPKTQAISNRIKALTGRRGGEHRFYCSDGCKKECPIYRRQLYSAEENRTKQYSREMQPELRQMVFERDNWTCQKCGSTKKLHCHHIEGVEINPIESADIDNCITLCKKCHKKVHKLKGYRYVDLQRKKC